MTALILAEIWQWLDAIPDLKGKLKDAVIYSQNQKKNLYAFLEHGEIEISNNQVKNAICPFVVGRKPDRFSAANNPQIDLLPWAPQMRDLFDLGRGIVERLRNTTQKRTTP